MRWLHTLDPDEIREMDLTGNKSDEELDEEMMEYYESI